MAMPETRDAWRGHGTAAVFNVADSWTGAMAVPEEALKPLSEVQAYLASRLTGQIVLHVKEGRILQVSLTHTVKADA